MIRKRTFGFRLFALAFVWVVAGCVQARPNTEESMQPARLLISRGTNGVNMQWMAEEGKTYVLYYRETRGADSEWKPVPGYKWVEGKGEMVEYHDRDPGAKERRYRVHTVSPLTRGLMPGKRPQGKE